MLVCALGWLGGRDKPNWRVDVFSMTHIVRVRADRFQSHSVNGSRQHSNVCISPATNAVSRYHYLQLGILGVVATAVLPVGVWVLE